MPLRVGFDTTVTLLGRSGVTRSVVELAAALERLDEVELVRLQHRPRPPRTGSGRIVQGLSRELVYYPLLLGKRARAAGVDVLHCPAHFAPRAVRRPVVLTVYDTLAWRRPELFTAANALQHRLVMRGAVRRAARIVTCSEHVRGEVVELLGVDPGRVVVTPLGVHERFRPAPPDEHALARLGVRRPYLLAVATVSPRKNLAAVVRAYSRIAADHPGLGLVIAGATGWRTEETDRAIRAAPSGVVTTGFVADEDLVALYNGAACLVFPSLEEGFGLPPLEAMACGTPVVASNTTSIPEVVGDAGLLVHPGDEEAIELAVRRVLEDGGLAEELRKRGLERARGFSWEACARLTVDVYRAARDH